MNPEPEDVVKSVWTDITQQFRQSAQELNPGELIHDESFSLFDAMSSIEMMDPKMDAGLLCNRKKVFGLEESIQMGLVKVKDFTWSERIGIMDETLACLVTWLEGHSFAQTVFTNLYLHKTSLIEDKIMRAFSCAMLAIVEFVTRFISKADVFEEEDFSPFFDVPYENPAQVILLMKEANEELQRCLKKCYSYHNSGAKKAIVNGQNCQMVTVSTITNLHARFKFTKDLFSFFHSLVLEMDQLSVQKKGQPIKFSPTVMCEELNRFLDSLIDSLKICKQTLDEGEKPCSSICQSTVKGDYPTIMGFSPLVNQKLLPPTFPRYVQIRSREYAMDYLERLMNRLRLVLQIYNQRSFNSVYEFVNNFTAHPWNESCVLTRSIVQVLYTPSVFVCFGLTPLSEVLREDAIRYVKPLPLLPRSPLMTTESKLFVDLFFRNSQSVLSELILIGGYNRARQRKKLSLLLDELANLLDEAVAMDNYFGKLYVKVGLKPLSNHVHFTTWSMYYVLRVCIHYVLSGFELELYAPHEYPYIYFYLSDCLLNWMQENLDRANQMNLENESLHEKLFASQKSKKNRNSKQNKKRKEKPHRNELLYIQALRFLCDALRKTVCGLELEQKIKRPSVALNNERKRYEQRFNAFRVSRLPLMIEYEQYRSKEDSLRAYCQTAQDFYRLAQKSFKIAKEELEALTEHNEEISNYLKVTKMNIVVNSLLLGGHKKDSKLFAEFDFSIDRTFPVIRVL